MKNLDPNDPKRLDGLTPQQIIEEIRQIATQYLKEFPSNGRVTWPESIRARVLALARLGVRRKKIAALTPIPAATIFLWCKGIQGSNLRRRPSQNDIQSDKITGEETLPWIPQAEHGSFIALPHVPKRSVVGLESQRTLRDTAESFKPGLRIRTPEGFEILGLNSLADLVSVYREISR